MSVYGLAVRSAAPLARQGVNYVIKSKVGKTLGSIALYETAAAGWDWMFGSEAEDQADVVEEILEVRKKLNDPATDPAELQALAAEDAALQEELEKLGLTIQIEDATPQSNQMDDAVETPFDIEKDGQYTPEEFARIKRSVNRVATLAGMNISAVPMFLEELSFLIGVGPDVIREVISV